MSINFSGNLGQFYWGEMAKLTPEKLEELRQQQAYEHVVSQDKATPEQVAEGQNADDKVAKGQAAYKRGVEINQRTGNKIGRPRK